MGKIFQMPPHLADLIAAGEVVERPGSVVKELIENSIDAGAAAITVEIRSGGMSTIRVTDNGCGIAPDDAAVAFLRHATSKLRDERGLEAIGTLGFRGEALAATAAVSRIEMVTKEKGTETGTKLVLEGGSIVSKEMCGCPDGTTIVVRDLFYNTPARLKFMKNDKAEGANVTAVVLRTALSHPEISFRYIREGKEEYHTPGDGKLESCIYCTMGREFANGLLRADSVNNGIKVEGYISSPAHCRGNRSWQFFFLNGRYIKSKLLQAAIEQAFKNSLFTGKFPVCVLNISMPLSTVDVNVHPAKLEVRFVNERQVFDAVYWAAKSALAREAVGVEFTVSPGTMQTVRNKEPDRAETLYSKPKESHFKTMSQEDYRELGTSKTPIKPSAGGTARFIGPSSDYSSGFGKGVSVVKTEKEEALEEKKYDQKANMQPQGVFRTSVPPVEERPNQSVSLHDSTRVVYQTKMEMPPVQVYPAFSQDEIIADEPEGNEKFKFIGEAMDVYLIAEKGGSIFLIDKHAAHERIIFDRLKAQKREIASQMLITPIMCNVGAETAQTLLNSRDLLEEFGFEIDEFGTGIIALRQIPADIDAKDPEALLEELAEKLEAGGRTGLEGMRDGVMHTIACKAAIKAGKKSEPAEVQQLIKRVLDGEVKYCPHGRPVVMEITKAQIDKSFKRT